MDEAGGPTRIERYVYVTLTLAFVLVFVGMVVTVGFGAYLDHLCITYRNC